MLTFYLLSFILVFEPACSNLKGFLKSQLDSFEILDPVRIISKRGVDEDSPINLHFKAFERSYHLVLRPGYSGATALGGLNVQVVRKNNAIEPLSVADLLSDFVHGHVHGQPNSIVSGFKVEDNLHLTIQDGVDTITLDPLSLVSGNLSDKRVLFYRESSIKTSPPGESFCALQNPERNKFSEIPNGLVTNQWWQRQQQQRRDATVSRYRRAFEPLSRVCRLQLVADHTFVKYIASGNVASAVKSLIKIVDDINQVYRVARFVHPKTNEVFTGIGFELANLRVFEHPDSEADHFNSAVPLARGYQYNASLHLEAFGDFRRNGLNLSSYCTNHLLTFRPMKNDTLGLAYPASLSNSDKGGICSEPSPAKYDKKKIIGNNIGMTTYARKDGSSLLSRQAMLVSAHELAHNLGAQHDIDRCVPSWADGGPYLMYWIAVTGNMDHHLRFSACSLAQIASVIKARPKCFTKPDNTFCGNWRRELGEECDAGSSGNECCDSQCRLKANKTCSDSNNPCCLGCMIARAGTVCQQQSPLHPCQDNATCDGTNTTCPVAPPLPDGTSCQFGMGSCKAGECKSVCSLIGQTPCSCLNEALSCLVCCRPRNISAECTPYVEGGVEGGLPGTINMPAKQPCTIGYCLANGTCSTPEPGSGLMIERLFNDFIQYGSITVAPFLVKNVVFSAIFITLLIWVPVCCIISYQDRIDATEFYQRVPSPRAE